LVAEGLGQPNVLFAGTRKLELPFLLTALAAIFIGWGVAQSRAAGGHAFAATGVGKGPRCARHLVGMLASRIAKNIGMAIEPGSSSFRHKRCGYAMDLTLTP
jgi:hypothetical protein